MNKTVTNTTIPLVADINYPMHTQLLLVSLGSIFTEVFLHVSI